MAKQTSSTTKLETVKIRRPGVHAKTKTSSSKGSQNYKKKYRGQGR